MSVFALPDHIWCKFCNHGVLKLFLGLWGTWTKNIESDCSDSGASIDGFIPRPPQRIIRAWSLLTNSILLTMRITSTKTCTTISYPYETTRKSENNKVTISSSTILSRNLFPFPRSTYHFWRPRWSGYRESLTKRRWSISAKFGTWNSGDVTRYANVWKVNFWKLPKSAIPFSH